MNTSFSILKGSVAAAVLSLAVKLARLLGPITNAQSLVILLFFAMTKVLQQEFNVASKRAWCMERSKPLIAPYRIVGNLIYTSGVTSTPGDAATQIRGCMEKLKKTLEDAGGSLKTVLKATVYLSDLNDRSRYLNDIWREYFPENPPGQTTVQVGLGPDVKVEIEMVAVKRS